MTEHKVRFARSIVIRLIRRDFYLLLEVKTGSWSGRGFAIFARLKCDAASVVLTKVSNMRNMRVQVLNLRLKHALLTLGIADCISSYILISRYLD